MKKFLILISIALPTLLAGQEKMINTKIAEIITMKIPEQFQEMSESIRVDKYVSSKTPIAMYTNESREVDFGINTNIMQWVDGDEEKLKSFYKGTFESLFDEIEYIQDTIQNINGKKFIVFEFVSTLKDENVFSGVKTSRNYSYIQYTSFKGQILLFNFTCKPRLMNQWQTTAKEMMESIKVKE